MKRELISIDQIEFETGELYLFSTSEYNSSEEECLWGVFDKTEPAKVCLETSSRNMVTFKKFVNLPPEYRYCRLASRDELRDYTYNQGCYESRSYEQQQDEPLIFEI